MTSKLAFQIALAILTLSPFGTGALIAWNGAALANDPSNATLDSHIRFFGGVWCGLGVALYWMLPNVERHATPFRIIAGAIVLGGLMRLASIFVVGPPNLGGLIALGLELAVAPAMILWHARLIRPSRTIIL